MKIHVFINCYWGTGISGGDRRILELLRRWKDCPDYSFVIYTTNNFYKLMKKEQIPSFQVVLVDHGKRSGNIVLEYLRRTRACIKELKRNAEPGDIFYSPTDILPDILPAAYMKKKNKNAYRWCMITFHIFELFYKRPGNMIVNFLSCYQQKYADYLGKRRADAILTTSPIVYDFFMKKGYDTNKLIMTDNAVDIGIIDHSKLPEQGYDACFLARLNYSKGIMELPIIWKHVLEKNPNARLAIMGKGSEEIVNELKAKIREENVEDKIDLLGYVEADRAYSLMKNSKLFLFTSHEEGWGMALAEALVCSIPVVAYDLPIYRILFQKGVNLCPLKDCRDMAKKVCYLLQHEEERMNQGREGREYILSHYSLDVVAKKELQVLLGTKA